MSPSESMKTTTDLPDCLRPLSPEELAKVEVPTDEEIERAMQLGRKMRRMAEHAMGLRTDPLPEEEDV